MLDLAGQDAAADGGSFCTFHEMAGHLDEWRWRDLEARDLFIGGLFSDILCDAPEWKAFRFAPAGSGKSTFGECVRAPLGGAADGPSPCTLRLRLRFPRPTRFL